MSYTPYVYHPYLATLYGHALMNPGAEMGERYV